MRLARSRVLFLAIVAFALAAPARADWKPAEGPLKTRWAKDVSPTNALPEYPRPQLVRERWLNLNGLWQFSSAKEGEQPPVGKDLHEQILVPYPVESSLSGLMRHEERMWYRRTFQVPAGWKGQHVLLHFGAVDWEADVYVNGKHLGSHKGGYDGFSFDVTDALKGDGLQELIVGVYDPTNQRGVGNQPRGKQVLRPGGIFYTPTSGIWETVWIEPAPPSHVRAVHVDAPAERDTVRVRVESSGPGSAVVRVLDGQTEVARKSGPAGSDIEIAVPKGKLWSPDSPFLYGLDIQFTGNDGVADHVTSYFGKRSIALQKDGAGFTRIALNGTPIFQTGPLDQGFWPDGIYTAPTDEALRYDIEITKKLGFNMTRKHVKVEPERWYYWADTLGLLVWQDMPAGDNRSP
jgi:beta-galactosidase/beta-glucuronidase